MGKDAICHLFLLPIHSTAKVNKVLNECHLSHKSQEHFWGKAHVGVQVTVLHFHRWWASGAERNWDCDEVAHSPEEQHPLGGGQRSGKSSRFYWTIANDRILGITWKQGLRKLPDLLLSPCLDNLSLRKEIKLCPIARPGLQPAYCLPIFGFEHFRLGQLLSPSCNNHHSPMPASLSPLLLSHSISWRHPNSRCLQTSSSCFWLVMYNR